MSKTCCFTGHRSKKFSFGYNESHPDCVRLKELLWKETEKAIQSGYTRFISGMAIGVDMWAAEIVFDLKKEYPFIEFWAAIPLCHKTRN